MQKSKPVKFIRDENMIKLPILVGASIITHFVSAINFWRAQGQPYRPLIIDFSAVQKPYSNGMLPIIAMLNKLRQEGIKINCRLPNDHNVAKLFIRTNWAHYLDEKQSFSKEGFDRHLHTRQFTDSREVGILTNDFMGIVLRSMKIPKDIVSALEWSIYEICDNVINHSESPIGGYVEAITYSKEKRISFTVADAGKGILASLKEGIPSLTTSTQAISEALKEGVTRNKQFGQGNGLNGSLKITMLTGGSFDISSGNGRIVQSNHLIQPYESKPDGYFRGTSVSGQIRMKEDFSIQSALKFNGVEYIPVNMIELNYELEDTDALRVDILKESEAVGTRSAGKKLNFLIMNLMASKPDYPVILNWEGIGIISSSFADEFLGKLYVGIGEKKFNKIIRNANATAVVGQLLSKAISQRVEQNKS
ncbi:MAG: hypothetical protein C0446_13270 [Chitinophaga sp.]|nr:hypothetical protein [Chitinophaga sp.]